MHVILIIAGSLVGVGAVLYLHHRLTYRPDNTEPETQPEPEQCCGMHVVCERDSLSPVFAEPIEYFDDEELDAYANTPADAYDEQAIELFRDVLLTLRPDEIGPWARSIQQRGIQLPDEIRDELIIVAADSRTIS